MTPRRDPRTVSVGPIQSLVIDGIRRITADVDGVPMWFESSDTELTPAPEAYGSGCLIPTLHRGARLRLCNPVDVVWSEHVREIVATVHDWWRYPVWPPETPPACNGGGPVPVDRPRALFFSGGVDSFYRLLRGSPEAPVDVLVSIQGFDFPLADRARAGVVESCVRRVAAETGRRSIIVRTNAREHPLVRATPWERAHGGVLAAVGHVLRPVATRIAISAGSPGDLEIPWGSHWRIDPLWSSAHTVFEHAGQGLRRADKVRAIAPEPLVRQHLRVCWSNRTVVGNCSSCNKCLFAMLVLEECGELQHSRMFAPRDELARRIAGLKRTWDRIPDFEELAASPRLDPEVVAAVHAFIRRSRHALRPDVRLRRAVVRWVLDRVAGLNA